MYIIYIIKLIGARSVPKTLYSAQWIVFVTDASNKLAILYIFSNCFISWLFLNQSVFIIVLIFEYNHYFMWMFKVMFLDDIYSCGYVEPSITQWKVLSDLWAAIVSGLLGDG